MSLPDGAEYWQDVKRHFARRGAREPSEPKTHAPADRVSLVMEKTEDRWSAVRQTKCGQHLPLERLRAKLSRVTCKQCLSLLCRFTVSHEVDGVKKILLATDDVLAAQERFYQAQNNRLINVILETKPS